MVAATFSCATPGTRCVHRVRRDGTIEPFGLPLRYPNFAVFDGAGRLWVSDSGSWGADDGALWVIDSAGRSVRHGEAALAFPNDLALWGEHL